jgi:hypothetical protein
VAESINDRTKASKLRKLKNPSAEQRAWLARYDERTVATTIRKAKEMPSASRYAPTGELSTVGTSRTGRADDLPLPRDPGPRAPQLALPAVIHETVPLDGAVTWTENTWIPTVPMPAPDAPADEPSEPPPPGTPPPPAAGSPLVEEAAAASTKGQGDPVAAAQFAMLVTWLCGVGIASGLELVPEDAPIPPWLRAAIEAEDNHGKVLTQIAEAAHRVAINHNFRQVPMADEAIVGGAVAASVLAFVAVQKRKLSTKTAPAAKAPAADAATRGVGDPDPKAPVELPPEIARLFT